VKRCLPGRVRRKIGKVIPDRGKASDPSEFFRDVDWRGTAAYSMGTTGNIFINLKGREPLGVVNPGREYDDLCNSIRMDLLELEDPANGRKVVEHVYRKEEIIRGKFINDAPDLIIEFSKGYRNMAKGVMRGESFEREKIIVNTRWSGDHEINGILIMKGPHIGKGLELYRADIMDVAPTVLHLMGIPVPEDMDGKVFAGALDRNFMLKNPVKYARVTKDEGFPEKIESYTQEDARKVKEKLKQLGYLE
jgi:predicted AlkP superfamily phosphohydrolase/phosphomutase